MDGDGGMHPPVALLPLLFPLWWLRFRVQYGLAALSPWARLACTEYARLAGCSRHLSAPTPPTTSGHRVWCCPAAATPGVVPLKFRRCDTPQHVARRVSFEVPTRYPNRSVRVCYPRPSRRTEYRVPRALPSIRILANSRRADPARLPLTFDLHVSQSLVQPPTNTTNNRSLPLSAIILAPPPASYCTVQHGFPPTHDDATSSAAWPRPSLLIEPNRIEPLRCAAPSASRYPRHSAPAAKRLFFSAASSACCCPRHRNPPSSTPSSAAVFPPSHTHTSPSPVPTPTGCEGAGGIDQACAPHLSAPVLPQPQSSLVLPPDTPPPPSPD
ncbi:hypothetical protein ACCO45_003315 [Purpureocillium lilacinum]|uniref:Uncharacterized protein n=1 Tax=Purpureocillium lilacinum TaxID=33203 RepID=A0ACC4DZJ9_PURLI